MPTPPARPTAAQLTLPSRLRGMNRNILIALGGTLALVLWMLSGVFRDHPTAALVTPTAAQPTVEVTLSTATNTAYTLTLTGRTSADVTANVVAEVEGRVVHTAVTEGKTVQKGDALLRLDVGTKDAELQRAKAAFQAATTIHHTTEKLFKQGFRAETDFIRSQADLAAAEANLKEAQRRLNDTVVRSPIRGVVERVMLDVGDFARPQQEVVRIVGLDQFLITAHVAQQDRGLLQVGQAVKATLANGASVDGILRFVGVEADPQTKTFPLEVVVKNAGQQPLPVGMTATLTLPAGQVEAHLLAHSTVVLDDDGRLGVMVLDAASAGQGRARFMPVKILQDNNTGLAVTGLPREIEIITRGQASIKSGAVVNLASPVAPTPATNASAGGV